MNNDVKVISLGSRDFLRTNGTLIPIDQIRDVDYTRKPVGEYNPVTISLKSEEGYRLVGEEAVALRRYFESL